MRISTTRSYISRGHYPLKIRSAPHSKSFGQLLSDPTLTLAQSVENPHSQKIEVKCPGTKPKMDEIPTHNEGTGETSNPQPTPEKEIDQRNQTIQQLEAALKELLEKQTQEAAIATEAVKRAEELAKNSKPSLMKLKKRQKT
ncbi:hypothetical protein PIB30_096549 [Stylosanthes scabra]|uniref:Uncharacterized protein n=1 Tax=Stylosanthes scabra TaxID=79078 RepID=A0ABU6SWD9_9FABA|nr:hypothetical protein [Stylosanthes scabra]